MPFAHLLLYLETVAQKWGQKGIRQKEVVTNQVIISFTKNTPKCIFLGKKPISSHTRGRRMLLPAAFGSFGSDTSANVIPFIY